jgi:hypothetical protein
MYCNAGYMDIGNEDGYYRVTTAALTEATGFVFQWKYQFTTSGVTTGNTPMTGLVDGDNDTIGVTIGDFFIEVYDNTGVIRTLQHNNIDSQPNVLTLMGKGTHIEVWINGRLLMARTNRWDDTNGGNQQIDFGYLGTSDWADGSISEVLIYDGGMLSYEANGCQISEFACWSADMTDIADDLYNSGTNLSVKEVCGVPDNFLKRAKRTHSCVGITNSPTTTSTSRITVPDMEVFALVADVVDAHTLAGAFSMNAQNNNTIFLTLEGDAETRYKADDSRNAAGREHSMHISRKHPYRCGLVKVEQQWNVSADTATAEGRNRTLSVEV